MSRSTLIRNETMDGETFLKVYNNEIVPDKVLGEDLMPELQKELDEQAQKKTTARKQNKKKSHGNPWDFFCGEKSKTLDIFKSVRYAENVK